MMPPKRNGRGRRYESTASAPWAGGQARNEHAIAAPALEPGATMQQWRALDNEDVAVAFRISGVWGILGGVGGVMGCITWGWPWQVGVGLPFATFAIAWYWRTEKQHVIEVFKRSAAKIEQMIPQAEKPKYPVTAKLDTGPHSSLYAAFNVTSAEDFHRFCKAVSAGDCNFSGRAAAEFGLENDWGAILIEFKSRGLVETGPARHTPKLTRIGKALVERFATTPPPEE